MEIPAVHAGRQEWLGAIQALPCAARHEAIGAFVSGLQGALVLCRAAKLVGSAGDHEGYYLLPNIWHADWVAEWERMRRPKDAVYEME